MNKYSTASSYTSVIALDVHSHSVTAHAIDRETGEVVKRKFLGVSPAAEMAEWAFAALTAPHYAAYESGCTSFDLSRAMRRAGVDCDVIAVSSIARSSDDKQRKSDKIDARRLLAELTALEPTYSVVWTPDEAVEGARDLARCREDAADDARRAKQRLSALLLRHGLVWDERTPTGRPKKTWGQEHWAWIGRADLGDEAANATLGCYVRTVRECLGRLAELDALVYEHSRKPRWKPFVDALCMLKGIDVTTAFLVAATFGSFARFKNGRSVSKHLGCVPKESSSGDRVTRGGITKAGDSHVRRALIEGCSAIMLRNLAPKKGLKGAEASYEVRMMCDKANRRLKARFDHLYIDSKKHVNKAKVAVVSEMVRWIWAIGLQVERELGA